MPSKWNPRIRIIPPLLYLRTNAYGVRKLPIKETDEPIRINMNEKYAGINGRIQGEKKTRHLQLNSLIG
jgi:hypothetical protein